MKNSLKFRLPYILFVCLAGPIGIYLSFFLNSSQNNGFWNRFGHSMLLLVFYEFIFAIAHLFYTRMKPKDITSLMKNDSGRFSWFQWCILKDKHSLTILLDPLFYNFFFTTFGLLIIVVGYIFLPYILVFEPFGIFTKKVIPIIIFTLTEVILLAFFLQFTYLYSVAVQKTINYASRSIKISNRKLTAILPFQNLKKVEIFSHDKNIFNLVIPITDIDIEHTRIKGLLEENGLILLQIRKKWKKEELEKIKQTLLSLISA